VAVAAAAADIAALSGGRFTLGLGFGTRGMRRRWYGLELDHPAPRFAEYVEVLRAAWKATDGLSHHGTFHDTEIPGYHLEHERKILDSLTVYGSGLHATMLATAASCDGIARHPLAADLHYNANANVSRATDCEGAVAARIPAARKPTPEVAAILIAPNGRRASRLQVREDTSQRRAPR
jgi:alkanesulfonate monooxygenase SsuD/methylene tetrahydromethanopterin reductase-like flavin-dependent oxidoreductase (luciferase family)